MVNSLYDLFDAPGTKPEAEQLIVNGRYMLPPIGDPTGKRRSLQRVTNFIKQISDTAGLEGWKLRSALQGLASREDLYDLASSLDFAEKQEWNKLVERCIDAAKAWQGSGGNETGTALHNYTDNVGKTPMRVRPKWIPKVENYQRALHEQGLRVVPGLSERLVVSEKFGTCGRLDDVYEDIYGIRYVADRKSQKEFYTWFEIGAQLALYGGSDAMWNEQTCSWESMPALSVDYGIVAWMPLVHPGPDPTAVELYHVPLEGPRELLDIMATVRTLRTQARRWASPMPELTAFERIARDIRDANSTQDLVTIRNFNLPNWSENLHLMAAKRWDELEAEAKAHPAYVPMITLSDGTQEIASYSSATEVNASHPVAPTARPDTAATSASRFELDWSKIGANLPRPHLAQDVSLNGEMRVSSETSYDFGNDTTKVTITGPSDAEVWERFAAMFEAPAQEATFPAESEQRVTDDVSATVPAPVLKQPAAWCAQEGVVVRDPDGWRRNRELGPKEWHVAITFEEFQQRVASSTIDIGTTHRVDQARPVTTAPYDQGQYHGAVVVELPADAPAALPTSQTDAETAIEALNSVSIKIVREVCGRAHNSKSSRGRVRLLNDVENGKYAADGVELIPALLREWLEIDGLNGEPGFNKDGVPRVANTGGSKREPMDARLAGAVSLSQFLKSQGEDVPERAAKKGSAAPAQGGTDAFGQPVIDVSGLPEAPAEEPGLQPYADAPAEQQGIRRQYGDITPDKHSVLRLVEMAKGAANGAERGLVFRELARRRAMTGAIAAEINQHYLDNGYTVEDFDPYFEQQETGHLADVVAPLVNNKPGERAPYSTLHEATLAELIANALDVETPSERGKVIHEVARRDSWGRMPLQELDTAWRNENLPGIPEIISDPGANYLRVVLPRIQECRTVSDLHELWNDLVALPCFHSAQAQEALQVQLRSVSP